MAFNKETLKHFWDHIDFLKANKDEVVSVDLNDTVAGEAVKTNADLLGGKESTYYAAAERVEVLESGVNTVPIINGNIITLDDASDLPLRNLKIYGKTTQNGTPTPDNPVELVTAGADGDIMIATCGKNLLGTLEIGGISTNGLNEDNTYITRTKYHIGVKPNTAYIISTYGGNGINRFALFEYDKDQRFIVKKPLDYIQNDADLKTAGFTTEETTRYVRLNIETTSFNANKTQLEEGAVATTYEPYNGQLLTLSTPNGLPGIPVSSGGNYTDASGRQWICDEIDLERGVRIQRVNQEIFDCSDRKSVV